MRSNSKSRPKGSVISRYCILSITCNVLFTEANHSIFPSIGHRKIHEGSLSFFPAGTMDAREQIFDTTLTKLRDDKVTDKDFSGVYTFTFQSNGEIGSGLNLGQENERDADTLKTSTTLRKATWQAGEQAKFKIICITLLIRVTHYSPEESQKMWDALIALTTHKSLCGSHTSAAVIYRKQCGIRCLTQTCYMRNFSLLHIHSQYHSRT